MSIGYIRRLIDIFQFSSRSQLEIPLISNAKSTIIWCFLLITIFLCSEYTIPSDIQTIALQYSTNLCLTNKILYLQSQIPVLLLEQTSLYYVIVQVNPFTHSTIDIKNNLVIPMPLFLDCWSTEHYRVSNVILKIPTNLQVTPNFTKVLNCSNCCSTPWYQCHPIVKEVIVVLSPPLGVHNELIMQLVIPAIWFSAIKQLVNETLCLLAVSRWTNHTKVDFKIVTPRTPYFRILEQFLANSTNQHSTVWSISNDMIISCYVIWRIHILLNLEHPIIVFNSEFCSMSVILVPMLLQKTIVLKIQEHPV